MRKPIAARKTITAWSFVSPVLVALALVGAYPLCRTLALSLTDACFYTQSSAFVGLSNYARLWSDSVLLKSLANTWVFTVASVSLQLLLGTGIALILDAQFQGRQLARPVFLIPFVIPLTVAAQLWKWMYHDVFGVINDLLMRLGVIQHPVAWIANPSTALGSIVAVGVWKFTPFVTLLILAGLQSIPGELYESAAIDGAGPLARFRWVTLPLLKATILVVIVFRMLDAIRVFDIIYVISGYAVPTMSIAMYARQQLIDFGQLGYGSAISVAIFVIVLLGTMLYMRLLQVRFD